MTNELKVQIAQAMAALERMPRTPLMRSMPRPFVQHKDPLTKKQAKARASSVRARKARRLNRAA